MTSLQTVVMGLVIVFLDIPPDGYDWIADPVGWVLVLLGLAALGTRLPNRRGLVVTAWACLAFSVVSWPEGSPATLTPVLGWLFSLPTLAWCFLVCDAVSDAVEGRLRWVLLGLRNAFLLVAPLPGLVYLADQDWLSTPAEVLILVANLSLLLALGSASGRPGTTGPAARAPARGPQPQPEPQPDPRGTTTPTPSPPVPAAPASKPRQKTVGFSAAEAKRKARARRERESAAASPPKEQADPSVTGAAPEHHPVTGAEVIEKVRRRRAAREKAPERDEPRGG